MHLDGHQGLDLGPIQLGLDIFEAHLDELVVDGLDLSSLRLHCILLVLHGPLERLGDLIGPDHLDPDEGDLRLILSDEVSEGPEGDSRHSGGGLSEDDFQLDLHLLLELLQPPLDVALALDVVFFLEDDLFLMSS